MTKRNYDYYCIQKSVQTRIVLVKGQCIAQFLVYNIPEGHLVLIACLYSIVYNNYRPKLNIVRDILRIL